MKKIDPSILSNSRSNLSEGTRPQVKSLNPHPKQSSDGIVSDVRPKLSENEASQLASGLIQSLKDDDRSLEAQGNGLTEAKVLDLLSADD